MLLTKDLIKDVDNENQIEMLKKVNIPDFTKCIAQFSGLNIRCVSDDIIKRYLLTWAKNKERFFLMLGKQLKVDTPFNYSRTGNEEEEKIYQYNELKKKFPIYAFWLDEVEDLKKNKLGNFINLSYTMRNKLKQYFPFLDTTNTKITHFFKSYLNAPEELVNGIAAIYENNEIEATHTISIDPVDMMLASDNPYGWESCYRLELNISSSHADGCLAAVLDNQSLITYIWNNEGKFILYNKYDFKSIRYKRMRQWIAISDKMHSIHFNTIYPRKR